jgi:hypothetical protein
MIPDGAVFEGPRPVSQVGDRELAANAELYVRKDVWDAVKGGGS